MINTLPFKTIKARFLRDTRGAVAAWAAIALPVVTAGAALSVDVARMQSLDNDLQAASDALARAGAAELDQRSDSMSRSADAIQSLVSNDKRGAGGLSDVSVAKVSYLKRLPSPQYAPITPDMITTDPSEARYVEVSVVPETIRSFFPTDTLGKFTDVTLGARSIAGMTDTAVCGSAPVFICNPFENDPDKTMAQMADDPAFQRRQIRFIQPGNNGTYSPGNFGWLDPFANNSGANVLRDAIAIDVSDVCVSKAAGVHLRPGKISSMSHGVNTRFDMYDGPYKQMSNDPRYAPAENVVKGYAVPSKGKGRKASSVDHCKAVPSSAALGMPRDASSSATYGSRIGNGDWDWAQYMAVNHPGFNSITIDGTTYRIRTNSSNAVPSQQPSRYQMYRWEIDNNCVPGPMTYGSQAVTPEEGLPQCHATGPSTTVEDRRVISVAVLNCNAITDSGLSMNGRSGPLPVEGFVKVFITEPMGKGQDDVLVGEIIGNVTPGGDAIVRDRIALVR